MFIMIIHMRLKLINLCSTKRSASVCLSLMTSVFIFASQYAWWIYQCNKSLFLLRWIQIFFNQLMIKTVKMITRLTNFNDMKCADEFALTHEHSIFNLLSEEYFASLDWNVLRVSFFRCLLNFFSSWALLILLYAMCSKWFRQINSSISIVLLIN